MQTNLAGSFIKDETRLGDFIEKRFISVCKV